MPHSPISQKDFRETSQDFDWAFADHYKLWYTGSTKRNGRIEVLLKRMTDKGYLRSTWHGNRKVYAVPRITKGEYHIEHGLACTEGLVRFWKSDMNGVVVPERYFRGKGSIPEWGIKYGSSILLYEYCSADQFSRGTEVQSKVFAYDMNLVNIERQFDKEGIVIFVIDAPREKVEKWVARVQPSGPYFFTDYVSFLQVPIGQQLTAEIYIYGDGRVLPLR